MQKLGYSLMICLGMLSAQAQRSGWTSLFNGKNLDGWHQLNGKARYEVKAGTITGTTLAGEPNSFLVTDKNYGDFILELDVKVGEMNSGIQIRSLSVPDYMNGRVHGYQIEIDPSSRGWSGGVYDEARRGWLYQNEIHPAAKKAFKKGEWNHYRIEAIGSLIRTWINDIPVAYLVDDLTSSGFIALQVHAVRDSQPPAQVSWKNIYIQTGAAMQPRKLDGTTPVVNLVANQLSEQEKMQGFRLLFNGNDLSGWRSAGREATPEKGWVVEQGNLVVADSSLHERPGDLVTKEKFSAFELVFDFALTPGANSGIKYFVEETPGSRSGLGLEFQILDDDKHPDAKMGTLGNRTLASLYDLIPSIKVEPRFRKKIGEWNQGRIVVYPNNHIEHWLNGFKVVEYDRGNIMYQLLVAHSKYAKLTNFGMLPAAPILLQDHGDLVKYRSIKIRTLATK